MAGIANRDDQGLQCQLFPRTGCRPAWTAAARRWRTSGRPCGRYDSCCGRTIQRAIAPRRRPGQSRGDDSCARRAPAPGGVDANGRPGPSSSRPPPVRPSPWPNGRAGSGRRAWPRGMIGSRRRLAGWGRTAPCPEPRRPIPLPDQTVTGPTNTRSLTQPIGNEDASRKTARRSLQLSERFIVASITRRPNGSSAFLPHPRFLFPN